MSKPKAERDVTQKILKKRYNVIKKLLLRGNTVTCIAKTISVNRNTLNDYILSHMELQQLKSISVGSKAFCYAIRDIQREIFSEANKFSQSDIRTFLVRDYWPVHVL